MNSTPNPSPSLSPPSSWSSPLGDASPPRLRESKQEVREPAVPSPQPPIPGLAVKAAETPGKVRDSKGDREQELLDRMSSIPPSKLPPHHAGSLVIDAVCTPLRIRRQRVAERLGELAKEIRERADKDPVRVAVSEELHYDMRLVDVASPNDMTVICESKSRAGKCGDYFFNWNGEKFQYQLPIDLLEEASGNADVTAATEEILKMGKDLREAYGDAFTSLDEAMAEARTQKLESFDQPVSLACLSADTALRKRVEAHVLTLVDVHSARELHLLCVADHRLPELESQKLAVMIKPTAQWPDKVHYVVCASSLRRPASERHARVVQPQPQPQPAVPVSLGGSPGESILSFMQSMSQAKQ